MDHENETVMDDPMASAPMADESMDMSEDDLVALKIKRADM